VAREFEEAHDTDDAEELEAEIHLVEPSHDDVNVEGQRRQQVDYVDGCPHEYCLKIVQINIS